MNQALHNALSGLVAGPAVTYRNFVVVPLLSPSSAEPGYLTLDEALAGGSARVTEVSQSGSVPELQFVNEGERPVFLLDGEELVGARQNRILNVSVLAPAKRGIVVPVSCVEAGRWSWRSRDFSSEGNAFFAEGRMRKMRQVSESLRTARVRHADQSDVWDSISDKLRHMGVNSGTAAMADVFRERENEVTGFVEAVRPGEGQVGALFAIDGEVRGLELFDSPRTLAKLLPKIVRSYALDAIDPARNDGRVAPPDGPASGTDADAAFQRFLARVLDARVEVFPAVGDGEDLRLEGTELTGGALAADGRIVHLCAFHAPHSPETGRAEKMRRVRRTMRE